MSRNNFNNSFSKQQLELSLKRPTKADVRAAIDYKLIGFENRQELRRLKRRRLQDARRRRRHPELCLEQPQTEFPFPCL